jgi:hypothetical protein
MKVKHNEALWVWTRLKTGKIARSLVVTEEAFRALFEWCMTGKIARR